MSVPISTFWPVAIGFLSLSINYFVQGGTTLSAGPNWGQDKAKFDRTVGLWGMFLGGFGQLITGIYLMVGLSWFPVYRNAPPLYMAAVAFSVYGIHWIVLGLRRYTGSDHGPEAWMAIPLLGLSVLGAISFGNAGDIPAMILFIGLTLIYICEIPSRFRNSKFWEKSTGLFQLLTGIWLLYLTYGVTLNFANGMHWWV
ncbi:hypothetical protein JI721_01445 [Alicyclobacillus cycloheptanicus]|uniref:Uncharacterized protein n=1 Tax=Alicyclobacillus cycloheptanicus TaxID=1457 RepID=A0ABT9XGR9_9BACL|nr:hypothetical protein [Alicyclobacillus cycloheptanicus]MDQ0189505.1 hypothetical protein [Alicyclobacillus cycloheptanicus]WDM01568.1 hypothetical protein JI721_01445 [Alicyclobacillus cycloheptanicus]